jgi:hypothetical protein
MDIYRLRYFCLIDLSFVKELIKIIKNHLK